MNETTTTTTTVRRIVKVPKPAPRLVRRKRTVKVTKVVVRGAKASVRRRADAAVPVKRAEVISVTTTKALPASPAPREFPAPTADELRLRRERQKVRGLR